MSKRTSRRQFLMQIAAAGFGASGLAPAAVASGYPSRPIRLIVPFSAGGPSDDIARAVATTLTSSIGQQVIVENRAGAEGMVAAEAAYNAAADGYTLFWSTSGAMVRGALGKTSRYDPFKFTPLAMVGNFQLFLFANPAAGINTVADIILQAQKRPGALSIGTSSFGDAVGAVLFQKMAGIELTRVPYRGAAQLMPDLIAGHIPLAVAPTSAGLPHVRSGALRAIAVFSSTRSPVLPGVPTMPESGVNALSAPWIGVFGPPGMPADVVTPLSKAVLSVLADPSIRAKVELHSGQMNPMSPDRLMAFMREDIERSRLLQQQYRLDE